MKKDDKTDKTNKTKKKREPLTSRDKAMLIITIVLFVILIAKSMFFSEVRNLDKDEAAFKDFVEYSVAQEYTGSLEAAGIIQYRVFDIYIANPDQKSLLRYEDPGTGMMIEKELDGRYNARVRKVLLWVFPLKEFSVTSKIVE